MIENQKEPDDKLCDAEEMVRASIDKLDALQRVILYNSLHALGCCMKTAEVEI